MSVPAAISSSLNFEGLSLKSGKGGKPRVLYAEDQTSSRIVTTALLNRMGLEVDAVEDGELALRKAEVVEYDVILLDIEMPVMDGVTAARCIRELASHSTTPILALSAFLADSTEHSIWRNAFDYALPKPANSNELQKAIYRMLATGSVAVANSRTDEIRITTQTAAAINQGLREVLTPGSWNRLQAMAAQEAVHYANAAVSAIESGDVKTHYRCLHALKALADSFVALDVVESACAILDLQEDSEAVACLTKELHSKTLLWLRMT